MLILVLAWAVCVLAPLGSSVLTEHEVFAAEPAREMLRGKGFVLQPFAGQFRTKKPPGQSWLIAASIGLTGIQKEWTARLPSALAALGVAGVTAAIGTRLASPRRGLIAGLMTLTCVGVQERARLAEADMALAFCVVLANAAVLWGVLAAEDPRRADRRPACVYWAAVLAGVMLKGPIILGFTLLPALIAWLVFRLAVKNLSAATATLRVAFWWPALAVSVLVIGLWLAAALHTFPGAVAQWKHELVDRVSGDLGHGEERRHDPLISYTWMLAYLTLPWFPFAITAVWAWRRVRAMRPAEMLIACWFGCGFVLISAVAFKVRYYALPIVPPATLVTAAGFDRLLTLWLRRRPRENRQAWERASLIGWFAAASLAWGAYEMFWFPHKDLGVEVPRFAARVNATVPAGQTVYLYRLGEDRTAWYLKAPLRQTTDVPVGPAFVICSADDLAALRQAGTITLLAEAKPFVAREATGEARVLVRID